MKKTHIQLISMGLLSLLLLGGGLFSYSHKKIENHSDSTSQTEEQKLEQQIFENQDHMITCISYTQNKENITLFFKENKWQNKESADFPLDQSKVSAMASILTNLTYYEKFPSSSGNLKDYGLQNSSFTVSFQTNNGMTERISFGEINAVTGYQYCLVDNRDFVYMIDASVVNSLSLDRDALMTYDSLPSCTASNVTKLILTSHSGSYQCTYSETGSPQQYTVYPWQETSKNLDTALDTSSFTAFLSGICSMEIAKCINYKPTEKDLKNYGLTGKNTCKATIVYQLEQDTSGDDDSQQVTKSEHKQYQYKIVIGKDYNKEYTYMTFSQSDYVYLIDKEAADTLRSFSPSNYEPLDVCFIPLDTVDTLDVFVGDKEHFTISRGSVATTDEYGSKTVTYLYYKDKKEIDSDSFETLYDRFSSMKAEKKGKETDTSKQKLVLQVIFHRNTKQFQEMALSFYTYNDNYYVAEFNGHSNLLVNRMDVEHFINSLQQMS